MSEPGTEIKILLTHNRSMDLSSGLQKIFEEKTLRLKSEFHEMNCCQNEINEFETIKDCLTKAKQLINHYQDVYFKYIESSKLHSMLEDLKFKKQDYMESCFDFSEIPNDADIIELKKCLENACKYIQEFESDLNELGFKDF